MNALLTIAALALGACVVLLLPADGPAALFLCVLLAAGVGYLVSRAGADAKFLLHVFIAALLVRVFVGSGIYLSGFQEFFGGDAFTYDFLGNIAAAQWRSGKFYQNVLVEGDVGWGMTYMVGVIYTLVGRNMLAVQYVNAVIGAATAPVIFLCAHHIFQNVKVARMAAVFVAFYPSLVLWSSQGLKDGPMVFLLAASMLATLKLGERLNTKYFLCLVVALVGILSFRFYVFYMVVAAIAGAFLVGMRKLTANSLARQVVLIVGVGLAMTYLGVLRSASVQMERYDIQDVQRSRADLATSAKTGFGKDVDITTTSGALSTIPLGLIYLLFAPFPWQLTSLRQSLTLPEMVLWWGSFPLLVTGLWFTLKYRLRQALPILIFTTMLTLAYSVFQGNVGTAYRQRSQLLIFYFIFVAVGFVLLREKQEDRRRIIVLERQRQQIAMAARAARTRREHEMEEIAARIAEKVGF